MEVQKRTKISYINVDSRQRNLYPVNTYEQNYRRLTGNPLLFTNGSNRMVVFDPEHNYETGQLISVSNVVSSINVFENIVMIKKSSMYVRIFHPNHGMSISALSYERVNYVERLPESFSETETISDINNKYYIAIDPSHKIFINIRGVIGTDTTGNFIGNIPVNTINGTREIILIYTNEDGKYVLDENSYLIRLSEPSNINYIDGIVSDNTIYINSLTLFGIPLNLINSGTPINAQQRVPYLAIIDTTKDTYTVEIAESAIILNAESANAGGHNVVVRRVISTVQGYPNASSFIIPLTRTFRNIVQTKIVASSFPNSQRTITVRNKIYWRDLESGLHIHSVSVPSGNYSARALENVLDELFSKVPFTRFTDFTNSYDDQGYYKYHIIKTDINTNTDIVSFRSYQEQILHDSLGKPLIITVPNNKVFFTQAANITDQTVMTKIYNSYGVSRVYAFNPTIQELFIFFTNRSHKYIDKQFPYVYGNIYKYVDSHKPNFSYSTVREDTRAFLFNFTMETVRELHSVNTETRFVNFTYNPINNNVFLADNKLKVNDIIVTDQIISLSSINFQTSGSLIKIFVVNTIIYEDNFHIVEYSPSGKGVKMIYSDRIINFSDVILPLDIGTELVVGKTLSFVDVVPIYTSDNIMIINQTHSLTVGDTIIVRNSVAVNRVPEEIINRDHKVYQIIDTKSYSVLLDPYTPLTETVFQYNSVSILFPTQIQMLFNFQDTLGDYLGFHDVGQETSITVFSNIITNQTPYEIPLNYRAIGEEYIQGVKKLSFTGPDYCYIQCPQLGRTTYDNTTPVLNVLNKIRWFDIPGTVVYDSFEPVTSHYEDPIRNLSQLQVNILNPDGSLYNFNDLNYSFTLEVMELYREVVNGV